MVQRVLDKIRYNLVLQVIKNKLAAIGLKVVPFYVFQNRLADIDKLPEIKNGIALAYEVNILGTEDVKYIGNHARGYSAALFHKFLNRGNICIGVKHNKETISFIWFDLAKCNFEPHQFELKENEAYGFCLYTMENYRGKNIAPYLLYHAYNILGGRNIDTFFSINEYFNRSSLKLKKKLNGRKLKLILYINLFNRVQWKMTLKNFHQPGQK